MISSKKTSVFDGNFKFSPFLVKSKNVQPLFAGVCAIQYFEYFQSLTFEFKLFISRKFLKTFLFRKNFLTFKKIFRSFLSEKNFFIFESWFSGFRSKKNFFIFKTKLCQNPNFQPRPSIQTLCINILIIIQPASYPPCGVPSF